MPIVYRKFAVNNALGEEPEAVIVFKIGCENVGGEDGHFENGNNLCGGAPALAVECFQSYDETVVAHAGASTKVGSV